MTPIILALSLLSQAPSRDAVAKPSPTGVTKKETQPKLLTPLARQLLRRRMERHGHDMMMLVEGVLLLQREVVAELAKNIAAEPRLTRPMVGGEADLNAALPERFFVLQDELHSRAGTLAGAAKTDTDTALAARLGELMQTCVSCHSTFFPVADGGTP
jgi:cytochrome c556